MRIWDTQPYAPADRQLKLFLGAQHGFEKVSSCICCCLSYYFMPLRIYSGVHGHQTAQELQQALLTGNPALCYAEHYYILYRFVYIWDTITRRIVYKLPGHQGSVNDVDFHPKEPICELSSL